VFVLVAAVKRLNTTATTVSLAGKRADGLRFAPISLGKRLKTWRRHVLNLGICRAVYHFALVDPATSAAKHGGALRGAAQNRKLWQETQSLCLKHLMKNCVFTVD